MILASTSFDYVFIIFLGEISSDQTKIIPCSFLYCEIKKINVTNAKTHKFVTCNFLIAVGARGKKWC